MGQFSLLWREALVKLAAVIVIEIARCGVTASRLELQAKPWTRKSLRKVALCFGLIAKQYIPSICDYTWCCTNRSCHRLVLKEPLNILSVASSCFSPLHFPAGGWRTSCSRSQMVHPIASMVLRAHPGVRLHRFRWLALPTVVFLCFYRWGWHSHWSQTCFSHLMLVTVP